MTRFVSRKEAALELGISRQAVEKKIKRGIILEVDGQIDIEDAKRRNAEMTDPTRRPVGASPQKKLQAPTDLPTRRARPTETSPHSSALSFVDARAQREAANAKLAELKYAEQSGRLIPRDEVARREFAIARKLRDRIVGFPVKLQQFLTPEAARMLVEECDQLVRELQEDAARIAEQN